MRLMLRVGVVAALASGVSYGSAQTGPAVEQGDYVAHDFHFRSGESLAEMKLHYRTLGAPHRDARGHVDNAVLILHGTGGTGAQFLAPYFAGVLFGPGQLLDATKYFIVLPDDIGHGGSSKPSDGMHAHFPKYDYDDMVAGEHLLLTGGLHVDHLRLTMGTSMGCMHSWVWGETYPEFSDALMPLACMPVQLAGRNRMMRKMAMDGITDDPAWKGGDYTTQPPGLRTALEMLLVMTSSPLQMQEHEPTRDEADAYVENFLKVHLANTDANDFLYAFNSSRNYDPSAKLETIKVPVMAVNSADDFVNPPELNIMPGMIKRVSRGKYVLLPITEQTRGHGTHTMAAIWQEYLGELLRESAR
ncbi:MAG: alpha/beta fold hydrolase [Acidobacteriaceae bacterium]